MRRKFLLFFVAFALVASCDLLSLDDDETIDSQQEESTETPGDSSEGSGGSTETPEEPEEDESINIESPSLGDLSEDEIIIPEKEDNISSNLSDLREENLF